jgi:predicted MFS family arabinose efflux permease
MAAAMGIGRFVYTPILPVMVEALGMSEAAAGLVASANFLGYLLGALAVANPRLGGSRRGWLLWALVASALSTGAMGLVGSMAPFLLLRFLGGAASAFVLVFASSLVLDRLAAAGRSALSAVHFAGICFGIVFAAVMVSASLALDADWQALWLVNAAAALAAALLVALLLPIGPEPTMPRGANDRESARGLGALVAAYGLFGFGYVVTATFIVAIVRTSPAIAPLEPIVWIIVGMSAIPSVALWGRVGRRIGVARGFALAAIVQAVGVAASVLWATPLAMLAAALLLGGTFMGMTALGLVGARRLARGDPRRILALMTASFGLGQILGPSFAGFAHDLTGSFLMPSIAAALALVVAALLAMGVRLPPD